MHTVCQLCIEICGIEESNTELIMNNSFDLTEGESELVSGFNVEYRSFLFAMF